MQLIPSLDLMEGRVVRLLQGDADRATFYPFPPEAWITRLVEAGARRIHLVDLDAAFGGEFQEVLRAFPKTWPEVRFQLGGGLRSREAVAKALEQGFDPVVGTLAAERPSELKGLDCERVIVALDLKGGIPALRGWREASACDPLETFEALLSLGFRRALVTEIERDGTLGGPGVEALRTVAGEGFQVQASGGIRSLEDLAIVARIPGVVGAISGRALLDGRMDLAEPALRRALRDEEV